MAKKQEDPPKGSPAWMSTFSDLMNLLLCFFVLLFSMSSIDAAKYDLVVNSLKSAFSILNSGGSSISDGMLISSGVSQMPDYSNYFGDTLNDTEGKEVEDGVEATVVEGGGAAEETDTQNMPSSQNKNESESTEMSTSQAQAQIEEKAMQESEAMAQELEKLATMYGLQNEVEIDYNGQYVRLTLNGALLFESGAVDVKPAAYAVVDNIGKMLDSFKDSLIEVEGHSDNVPIRSGRYEDNDVLSMYRALNVANRLRDASDINPGNITSSGRGSYAPIADNATAEGRARNRRVEIKIFNSFNSDVVQSTNQQ